MNREQAIELAVETLHDLYGEFKGLGLDFPDVLNHFRNPNQKNKDISKARSILNKLLADFEKKTKNAKTEVEKHGKEVTYSGYDHPDPSVQKIIDEQRAIYWKYDPIVNKIREIIGFMDNVKG